jgi:AP-1 complex subunit mu
MWTIKNFPGQTEINLRLQFLVPTVRSDGSELHMKKPISVKFDIPSFTVSGIQVRYLKIQDKTGYQAFPYVKYITMNGDYHIRMV